MAYDAASAVLVAAFESEKLSAAELRFFAEEQPAGVTLFGRNLSSSYLDLKANLNKFRSLYSAARLKPVLAIDQEGGRVARLKQPFPDEGPAEQLAERLSARGLAAIANYAFCVGASLRSLGINVNFAPVCDINTNPENLAIGDRAFGSTAAVAEQGAGQFLLGLQAAGVLGCLKHFPGQGDADADTHLGGTVIGKSLAELEACELQPFQALLAAAPMVMISHAVFPAFDDKPASLSTAVVTDLLREKLQYSGVIVTDDLNMKALPQDMASWTDLICEAVAVGSDMLLVCRGLDKNYAALEALRRKAAASPSFAGILEAAAVRVSRLRSRLT